MSSGMWERFLTGLRPARRRPLLAFVALLVCGPACLAQYQRPVDAAPCAEDIGGGYVTPSVQRPLPRAQWRSAVDVAVLAAALGLSSWLVLKRRSRNAVVVLTVGCLAYFGFYREGCICPIGAIQNVTVALLDPRYAISYFVVAFFFLPLIFAVLFGRVFCGGVCPLGAIQELVVLKPLRVPRLVDKGLGLLKWAYLLAGDLAGRTPGSEPRLYHLPIRPVRRVFSLRRTVVHAPDRRRAAGARRLHRPAVLPLSLPVRGDTLGAVADIVAARDRNAEQRAGLRSMRRSVPVWGD